VGVVQRDEVGDYLSEILMTFALTSQSASLTAPLEEGAKAPDVGLE
jgi:hypothetical protein